VGSIMPAPDDDGDSTSPFDAIRQLNDDGTECWSARDLMNLMGYTNWQSMMAVIERAMIAAAYLPPEEDAVFSEVSERTAGCPRQNFYLNRMAVTLVAVNGDPRKPEVAALQGYMVRQTMEIEQQTCTDGPWLGFEEVMKGFQGSRNGALYVVSSHTTIKVGITNVSPERRLSRHRADGFTLVERLITGLRQADTKPLEGRVLDHLRSAGFEPVRGDEYFDRAALPKALAFVDLVASEYLAS
jgi:hypothetical protein